MTDPPGAAVTIGEGAEDERLQRGRIVQHAREFLMHLDAMGRQLTIYDPGNAAVRQSLERLIEDIRALQAETGEIALAFADGHAFVNGVWVRASRRTWEAAVNLTERLKGLGSRGLVLEEGVADVVILELAQLLRKQRPGEDLEALEARADRLQGVRLLPLPSQADLARMGNSAARQEAVDVFREGLLTLSDADLATLDLFLRRRQRALVKRLVALCEESPEEALALTAMRDPSLPAQAHSLMVCIYAVTLGRQLDLSRRTLVRLGVAALSHNLGEALVDSELFSAARELSPGERGELESHTVRGALHVVTHHGLAAPALERALASLEHHVHHDGRGGYPYKTTRPAHLFSRIIAVADVFDALSQERPWRKAWAPDQAVKLVLRRAGRQLDPVLVRAMVKLIGRYPPGSLVELDTGVHAVVLGPGKGLRPLERPRVLLITDERGQRLRTPVAVDLGERHPKRRAWLRTVVRARNPELLGEPVARLLFGPRLETPPGRMDIDEARELKRRRRQRPES